MMGGNQSSLKRVLLTALAAMFAAPAVAAGGGASVARSYDAAVSCKALSEVASNAHDRASKIAIAHIDTAIEMEIAAGATRDQTLADIDYARVNWRAARDIATLQSEWRKCVVEWKD